MVRQAVWPKTYPYCYAKHEIVMFYYGIYFLSSCTEPVSATERSIKTGEA
jgi:hypothetical protein